ncbi:GtrA family protein [Termitidicoccus mucosus]|uniref:GtrA family protein n=1 Tax=Termitidicoccus mucosus TaxID=1184151 RepID=UPI0009FC7126
MLNLRLIKFLLVGVLNTLVGYGLFCFFVFTGLHYSFAVLIATILGVLFNFQSTRKLVFNDRHGCGLPTLSLYPQLWHSLPCEYSRSKIIPQPRPEQLSGGVHRTPSSCIPQLLLAVTFSFH